LIRLSLQASVTPAEMPRHGSIGGAVGGGLPPVAKSDLPPAATQAFTLVAMEEGLSPDQTCCLVSTDVLRRSDVAIPFKSMFSPPGLTIPTSTGTLTALRETGA
jgi:hypothetical protein